MRVIIVGAGLFGSILSDALEELDCHETIVIDDARPGRGSVPAACLMAPGWMSSLPKAEVKSAMELLDQLYNVQTIKFQFGPIGKMDINWVDPRLVLQQSASVLIPGRAKSVHDHGVLLHDGRFIDGDAVIVCAGVWSGELVPTPVIKRLAGVAYTFQGHRAPHISVWAPYKQLIMFEREPGMTWIGDGSAILDKNWNEAREDAVLGRCRKMFGDMSAIPVRKEFGLRPYIDGHKGGYLAKVSDRVWVNTGGAKNGTIIAAIHANKLREQLRD